MPLFIYIMEQYLKHFHKGVARNANEFNLSTICVVSMQTKEWQLQITSNCYNAWSSFNAYIFKFCINDI